MGYSSVLKAAESFCLEQLQFGQDDQGKLISYVVPITRILLQQIRILNLSHTYGESVRSVYTFFFLLLRNHFFFQYNLTFRNKVLPIVFNKDAGTSYVQDAAVAFCLGLNHHFSDITL
jgi:hypothetical protein